MLHRHTFALVSLLVVSLAPTSTTPAQGCPAAGFDPRFGGAPPGDAVDVVTWNDGTGLTLYVAHANTVLRWTGTELERVEGGAVVSTNPGAIRALAVFDDGSGEALYAAGTRAPGNAFVARWDGTAWVVIGTSTAANSGVMDLEVHDDGSGTALYAGGFFTQLGGAASPNVARWDGLNWSAVGAGTGGFINVMLSTTVGAATGPELMVGGLFAA